MDARYRGHHAKVWSNGVTRPSHLRAQMLPPLPPMRPAPQPIPMAPTDRRGGGRGYRIDAAKANAKDCIQFLWYRLAPGSTTQVFVSCAGLDGNRWVLAGIRALVASWLRRLTQAGVAWGVDLAEVAGLRPVSRRSPRVLPEEKQ